MSILVTGGTGFLGLNVVEHLLDEGEHVVVFDRHGLAASASEIARDRKGSLEVVVGDVADEADVGALFGRHEFRKVIHTAAITAGPAREASDARTIVDVNINGTLNVLHAARAANCTRVVYVGSGQAYGETHDEGLRLHEETSPSRPVDIYGITKFAAEQMALRLAALWPLDVVCVRLGSLFGPWEFDTGVRDMLSPYLQTARLAVRGERAVVPAREVWRDWIYSRDAASALAALTRADVPKYRLYHLASGIDWRDTFGRWCDALRHAYPRFSWRWATAAERPNVTFVVERDRSPMDIGRLTDDLGFEPRFGPDAAYGDYASWLVRHEAFVHG